MTEVNQMKIESDEKFRLLAELEAALKVKDQPQHSTTTTLTPGVKETSPDQEKRDCERQEIAAFIER